MSVIDSPVQTYTNTVKEKNKKITTTELSLSPVRFEEGMTVYLHGQDKGLAMMERMIWESRYTRWTGLNEHIPSERLLRDFKACFVRTTATML